MNKQKEYKKKYGQTGVKIVTILFCLSFAVVILATPENITSKLGAIVALLLISSMLTLLILDLVRTKYDDAIMILSECKKISKHTYECVFYDEQTDRSIGFVNKRMLGLELEKEKSYRVVFSRYGEKIMILDIIGTIKSEIISPESTFDEQERKISLMEYKQEQAIKAEKAAKLVDTTLKVVGVAEMIKGIVIGLVGVFFIICSFNSKDTFSMIVSLVFGTLFVIGALIGIFRKK